MYTGKKATVLTIGDKEYNVPPLSLGQLRNGALELLKEHDALSAQPEAERSASYGYDLFQLRGRVILLALQRNYPELTEDFVFGGLDMENTNDIFLKVIGLSGFNLGEAVAAAKTGT